MDTLIKNAAVDYAVNDTYFDFQNVSAPNPNFFSPKQAIENLVGIANRTWYCSEPISGFGTCKKGFCFCSTLFFASDTPSWTSTYCVDTYGYKKTADTNCATRCDYSGNTLGQCGP